MASAKQLAARARFAAASRAGKLRKGSKLGKATSRKSTTVAKRSIRTRVKSAYRRAASSGVGRRVHLRKSLLPGAAAGALAPYAGRVAGAYGPGIAMAGVGIAMENDTLQTMGAFALGATAVQQLTAGTQLAATAPSGGFL